MKPIPRVLRDAALAAAVLAGTLAVLAHGGIRPRAGTGWPTGANHLDALGVLLAAGSALPLLAGRRAPLAAFAASAAASAALAGLGYPLDVAIAPAAALYLLAAGRARDVPWAPKATATVLGLLLAYLAGAGTARGGFPAAELLHTGLAWAVGWFAGERTRLRHLHVADLRERARRAERDAETERRLAAAEERARIARDLHDSAGHAISVIAVRAGAARLRHREDPDRSLAALEAIEELARATADEIDQIVGTLRDADAPDLPPAGLASLDTLVARHQGAGLAVTVETSGPLRRLGIAADRTAYRILQEALTNAARHGTGSARVELAYGAADVELTVTNPTRNGRGAPRPGGGHGLPGMRERATSIGGDLRAERVDGTFRVRARIPL